MRGLGIGLTAAALLYYGLLQFSPLARFSESATGVLEYQLRDLDRKLEFVDRNQTIPDEGMEGLDRMRSEQTWIGLELRRRAYGLNRWAPVAGGVGLGLVLLSFVRIPKRRGRPRRSFADAREEVSGVFIAAPREMYVDEWEFERHREGGFPSRDEAVGWIRKDPLKKCEYCGGTMRPTGEGSREGVELVTFYKKVPEGARDLRVVLGSFWFVKAASELRCTGCERIIRR